jgi:hypothetical protein
VLLLLILLILDRLLLLRGVIGIESEGIASCGFGLSVGDSEGVVGGGITVSVLV